VLGEMLAVIDLSNTYVIFIGDNGTPQNVAPDPTRAKGSTYERGIHVPLVVAHNDLTPAVSSSLVHAVDLTATIAELGGIPIPVEMDSRSFVRCLSKPSTRTRNYVYCQDDDDRCVRSRRYKLRVDAGVEEFYDLVIDPTESMPLDVDDPALLPLVERFRDVMTSIGL
jgi:arylsulfatase A-like enzyme